jgi:hypothetical protein
MPHLPLTAASTTSSCVLKPSKLISTPKLFAIARQISGAIPVGSPEDDRPVTNKKLPKYTAADRTPLGASCILTSGETEFIKILLNSAFY